MRSASESSRLAMAEVMKMTKNQLVCSLLVSPRRSDALRKIGTDPKR
jgi:hypothetical protein